MTERTPPPRKRGVGDSRRASAAFQTLHGERTMAKYFGTMDGRGKRITATGTDASGIAAEVMSRTGTIGVRIWTTRDGAERCEITVGEHSDNGGGIIRTLVVADFAALVDVCREQRDEQRAARTRTIDRTEADALALDVAADADPVAAAEVAE